MSAGRYILWGGGPTRSMLVEMVLAEAGADVIYPTMAEFQAEIPPA